MAAWGTFSDQDDCYSVLKRDVKKMGKEMKNNMDLIENMQQAFEQCAKQCCMTSSSSTVPRKSSSTKQAQQSRMDKECTCTGLTIKICHQNIEPSKSTDKSAEKKLIASVDLKGFHPDEVSAKLKDRNVIVCAKHEDCQDSDGKKQYCCKTYSNMFTLPPDVDEDSIVCCLEDNTLKIKASSSGAKRDSERCLPILRKC
ncbi:uncharacterized protein LOC115085610 isoform X2 [Rhinatrema bivittatum]|uniref:uncharacterized protein LOC115085610 isoform X2 n=1 Tax=Rhinatrema bivittatum TaxID=194408 RepID=UPI00112EB04E|nr:uncharacterized protein LOC115085610 isoform X2 [Rhinatrema bivittatum]